MQEFYTSNCARANIEEVYMWLFDSMGVYEHTEESQLYTSLHWPFYSFRIYWMNTKNHIEIDLQFWEKSHYPLKSYLPPPQVTYTLLHPHRCLKNVDRACELRLGNTVKVGGSYFRTSLGYLEELLTYRNKDNKLPLVITLKDNVVVSDNGQLFWKVERVTEKRLRMLNKFMEYEDSPHFYTHPKGYRVSVRLRLDTRISLKRKDPCVSSTRNHSPPLFTQFPLQRQLLQSRSPPSAILVIPPLQPPGDGKQKSHQQICVLNIKGVEKSSDRWAVINDRVLIGHRGSIGVAPNMDEVEPADCQQQLVQQDRRSFVRRLSDITKMELATGSGSGTQATVVNKSQDSNLRDKKRRKVVILIAVVTFALLLMSVLLMVITIQLTPSIDERIRKEHEERVRKMSEGIIKQDKFTRSDNDNNSSISSLL